MAVFQPGAVARSAQASGPVDLTLAENFAASGGILEVVSAAANTGGIEIVFASTAKGVNPKDDALSISDGSVTFRLMGNAYTSGETYKHDGPNQIANVFVPAGFNLKINVAAVAYNLL